jgi:stage IV sporulation protein B
MPVSTPRAFDVDSENALHVGFDMPDGTEAQGSETYVAAAKNASYKDLRLYPGGLPFGVKFYTDGLIVIGFSDIEDGNGRSNPAYDAGLREKDVITKINGKPATGVSQLTEEVERTGGGELTLTCKRAGRDYVDHVTPKYSETEGRYRTGLPIRDSGAGIGTLTFIDPNSLAFGGLGHGICDGDTGELIPMDRGSVLNVTISGITKGASGAPGEIKGYFGSDKTGSLISNTACGVYGHLASLPDGLPEEPLPIAQRSELRDGDAYIYCTLDDSGIPCRYAVKISDINRSATGNKCFTVKVTDPKLIEKTGGIVRGMSGSPIIQNGKLVGAVTHVLVNDPTSGYGIFIENMLNQMSDLAR